jgi:hypothetical protein
MLRHGHEASHAGPQQQPRQFRAPAERAAVRDAAAGPAIPAAGPRQHGHQRVEHRRPRRAGQRAGRGREDPAETLAQPPHRQGPDDRAGQRGPGGGTEQQADGQRELDRRERGVPRGRARGDSLSRQRHRARDDARLPGGGHRQHVGEPPGEHVRLVLQRGIEQPDRAEGDLERPPEACRLAVGRPGKAPRAGIAAERGLRRRREQQGGERRQRGGQHDGKSRPGARDDHRIAAEVADGPDELDEQVAGERGSREPAQAGQPAGGLPAAGQLPDPGGDDDRPGGGQFASVAAADAGYREEPGEGLDPRKEGPGDDERARGHGGEPGGAPASRP